MSPTPEIDNSSGWHVLEGLPTGVMVIRPSGRVLFSNRSADQLLGCGPLSETSLEDWADRECGAFVLGVLAAVETNVPVERAEAALDCDPLRVLGYSVSPTDGGFVVLFREITELHRMRDRLDEAENFALIADVAGAIAHEIRNPLTAISASVELLAESAGVDAKDQGVVEIIVKETRRTGRILEAFQQFAHIAPPRRDAVDPLELIGDAMATIDWPHRQPPVVRMEIPTGVAERVLGHADSLRRALANILRNALEAAGPTGSVSIAVEDLPKLAQLRIVVRDSGPGIPEEILSRVHKPFFTTRIGHSGLGLAVAKRIIDQHGGALSFDRDRGTVVRLDLPTLSQESRNRADLPRDMEEMTWTRGF